MKILVVHQYYLFEGQPGGSRFNEMCRYWAAAGHDVTVIAGTVNYATGETPSRYRRRWITRERDGEVTIYRCHVPSSYRRSYPGRMWAFFAFTLSALTAVFAAPRADVVVATSPPLVATIPGWVAARLRGRRRRWVFEIRDIWPESAITTGVIARGGLLARLLFALERWACRRADLINVLTPAFREDLIARGLAGEEKIIFVPNGADIERFEPGPRDNEMRRALGWGDRFVVLYAGAHGRANALDQLVEAARRLAGRADILIACVGDGPELARLRAASSGMTNIVFHGPRPKEEMPELVNACDAGAAVLQNNPTFRTVYPNKVFDYMACARPVLLAIDGVARQLVCDEADAGLFAEPENAGALAACIERLAGDAALRARMGGNGRAWVLANARRDALAARYLQSLQRLAAAR